MFLFTFFVSIYFFRHILYTSSLLNIFIQIQGPFKKKVKNVQTNITFANFITYSSLKDTLFDLGHFLCAYLFMEKTFKHTVFILNINVYSKTKDFGIGIYINFCAIEFKILPL